ncbi:hypothetical protein D3C75_522220 [compost metagenome]
MDVIVIRDEVRVSGSMMAYRLILLQIFTHWLPRAGPIIPVLQISHVNIASGLVLRVEVVADMPPICARLYKAIAACVT